MFTEKGSCRVKDWTCQNLSGRGNWKDEGLNPCVGCTLFALLARCIRAERKRNVCANGKLLGVFSVGSAVVGMLGADGRILSRHVKILNADGNFLGADAHFLFAADYFLNQFENFLRSSVKWLKAEGSFVFAEGNSLCDVGYFLKEVVSLLFLGTFELQFADLFKLRACCSENWLDVFLHF